MELKRKKILFFLSFVDNIKKCRKKKLSEIINKITINLRESK